MLHDKLALTFLQQTSLVITFKFWREKRSH